MNDRYEKLSNDLDELKRHTEGLRQAFNQYGDALQKVLVNTADLVLKVERMNQNKVEKAVESFMR